MGGTAVSPVRYTRDAENRLSEVLPAEDDPNNLTADDKKLVFTYDYLNRRVRKLVYAWDPNEGESGDWSSTAELDLRFIYHERLLLLELDGLDSGAKVRKHVWGPGQNPKRQRGVNLGGLNSLLAIRDVDSTTNYVCFNNGSGSVAQLLDRSDGSVDAKYVYDTRGDTVRNTGTYAADNPLRCQAMYFDAEFDYADTSCDGLYCAADGTYYSPRLARSLTPLPSHLLSVAHAWTGSLGNIDDVPSIAPPAPLNLSDNISVPLFDSDDDDEDDEPEGSSSPHCCGPGGSHEDGCINVSGEEGEDEGDVASRLAGIYSAIAQNDCHAGCWNCCPIPCEICGCITAVEVECDRLGETLFYCCYIWDARWGCGIEIEIPAGLPAQPR